MSDRLLMPVWFPPKSPSRFYDYDIRDEMWMQPLGLGETQYLDITNTVARAEARIERKIIREVFGY